LDLRTYSKNECLGRI